MIRLRALAYFALLAAVFIWGANFVVVKRATQAWKGQEFTFLAIRFWIACITYMVFLSIKNRTIKAVIPFDKRSLTQASLVGFVLMIGYALQVWYLSQGSAVKAAFLTSTTVLWAPILAFLWGQRVYATTIIGAVVAMTGILCIEVTGPSYRAGWWDAVAVLAAITFAVEILLVSRFAPKMGSIQWTTMSCLNVAVIMTVLALVREPWSWPSLLSNERIIAVVFTGVFATALALGLQNWAQAQEINNLKIIDGPRAALISTLEPVFTTLVSGFILQEYVSGRGAVGCFLVLSGTLVSEFASAKRTVEQQKEERETKKPNVIE